MKYYRNPVSTPANRPKAASPSATKGNEPSQISSTPSAPPKKSAAPKKEDGQPLDSIPQFYDLPDANERFLRREIIRRCRGEYIHQRIDTISADLFAGKDDPPAAWLNECIAKSGVTWRVPITTVPRKPAAFPHAKEPGPYMDITGLPNATITGNRVVGETGHMNISDSPNAKVSDNEVLAKEPTVGTITQGPGNITQIGGTGNTATVNNTDIPPAKVRIIAIYRNQPDQVLNPHFPPKDAFGSLFRVSVTSSVPIPHMRIWTSGDQLVERIVCGGYYTAPTVGVATCFIEQVYGEAMGVRVITSSPDNDIQLHYECEGIKCE